MGILGGLKSYVFGSGESDQAKKARGIGGLLQQSQEDIIERNNRALRGTELADQSYSRGYGQGKELAGLATQRQLFGLGDQQRQQGRMIDQGVARRGIAGLTSVGLGARAAAEAPLMRERSFIQAQAPLTQEMFAQQFGDQAAQRTTQQRQQMLNELQGGIGLSAIPEIQFGKRKGLLQRAGGLVEKTAGQFFGAAGNFVDATAKQGLGGLTGGGSRMTGGR